MYCGPTRPNSKFQADRNSFKTEELKRSRGRGELIMTGWYDTVNHRLEVQQGDAAPGLTWEALLHKFFPEFYEHFGNNGDLGILHAIAMQQKEGIKEHEVETKTQRVLYRARRTSFLPANYLQR